MTGEVTGEMAGEMTEAEEQVARALELLRASGFDWVLTVLGPDGRLHHHAADLPPPPPEPEEIETFLLYDVMVLDGGGHAQFCEEPGGPRVPCTAERVPPGWPPFAAGVTVPRALGYWSENERLVIVRAYCAVCGGSGLRPEAVVLEEGDGEVHGPCPACGGTGDYHYEEDEDGQAGEDG